MRNFPVLYYPGIWLCYNTLLLYPVSSLCGHLPVVKDERKFQTFGSKSGRSRLQAVSNIVIWLWNFWY